MSTAPTPALTGTEGEIRMLRDSHNALLTAVAAAERGRDATAADLVAVQKRLTSRAGEALPHDQAIRQRITAAIESAFTTALHSLTARWDEIVKLLRKACERIGEALKEAEHRQRQREAARIQAR